LSINSKKIPVLILCILTTFVVLLNIWWVTLDTREMCRKEQPKFLTIQTHLDPQYNYQECAYYPPAFFWVNARILSLFNVELTYDYAVFINMIYLICAMGGLYLLGQHVMQSPWYGMMAPLILLGFPDYLHLSRRYIGEFALTTSLIIAVYFIITNPKWQERKKAIYFGIIAGIGMLFKWSFMVYIIGPLLITFIYAYKGTDKKTQNSAKKNILISFAVTILICGYWYLIVFNPSEFIHELMLNMSDGEDISLSYWKFLKNNFLLSLYVFNAGITSVFSFLSACCLALVIKKSGIKVEYLIIMSWFLVPYILFTTIIGDIMPRYLLPALPAVVLLILLGIKTLNKKKRVVIATGIALYALFSIYFETFIHRSPQGYFKYPLQKILKHITEDSSILSPNIIFNGVNDIATEGEVLDIFNLFSIHNMEDGLQLELTYVKDKKNLLNSLSGQFIVSQDISQNDPWHKYFENKRYRRVSRFNHHFFENIDPRFDWEPVAPFLLFEKRETQ